MSRHDDRDTTLQDVKDLIAEFTAARDWQQFHCPKNVAMALVSEASELMAHFRWTGPGEGRGHLGRSPIAARGPARSGRRASALGRVRQRRRHRHGRGRPRKDGNQLPAVWRGEVAGDIAEV